jgi:Coenzyme PQQ synthesis protein D (PqqD)
MISFSERATVPSNVLIRLLDQESVLLNLETERYFGLDAVGTRMWQVLTAAPTVEAALAQLVGEYDAPVERLRTDLAKLLEHLVENGLIAMQAADVGTASEV